MKAAITVDLVKSLKPEAKPYEVLDPRLKGFLLRVQPSGSMTYYAQYGRGKRHRIGPADALAPSKAFERARIVLAGATLGDEPTTASKEAKAHTLRSFLDEVYEPWANANIRTPKNTLGRLRANFPDLQNKKLGDINPWLAEKWRASRLKAGAKATTVNRDLDDLRSSLGKAVEWDIDGLKARGHPLAGVKRSKADDNAIVRYLDDDEEKRLRAALDAREERIRGERDRANAWRAERGYPTLPDLRRVEYADYLKPMVLVSLNTGIRRGELFSLEWQDIKFKEEMVGGRRMKPHLTVRGQSAKSRKVRHLPLNAEALAVLQCWRAQRSADDILVFPGRDGARLDNIRKSWTAVLSAAKIARFRWHDMRHHFASRLVMAGVSLNTVRELLGHADYKMTLRYAHLDPEHTAAAVEKLVRAG
jgi:integrase